MLAGCRPMQMHCAAVDITCRSASALVPPESPSALHADWSRNGPGRITLASCPATAQHSGAVPLSSPPAVAAGMLCPKERRHKQPAGTHAALTLEPAESPSLFVVPRRSQLQVQICAVAIMGWMIFALTKTTRSILRIMPSVGVLVSPCHVPGVGDTELLEWPDVGPLVINEVRPQMHPSRECRSARR